VPVMQSRRRRGGTVLGPHGDTAELGHRGKLGKQRRLRRARGSDWAQKKGVTASACGSIEQRNSALPGVVAA
jgi:hypothetical protein